MTTPMIQVTITGKNAEELIANATSVIAMLSSTSAKAIEVLSASEQSRLRGDATVVPPKTPTAAEKKAAKKAADEAAAAKAAEEAATDDADETGTDDDVLGEDEGGDAEETLTSDDVKKLLVEVRTAFPKEATIISEIVQKHGKAKKLSDVEDKNLAAIAAECRKRLKAAKK